MKKGLLITLLLTTILLSSNLIISEEDTDLENFTREIDEIKTIEKNTQYPKIQSQLISLTNSNFKTNSDTFNQFSPDLVDDRIRVEVSLTNEQAMIQLEEFSNNITVENHYKSLAQILIPLDLLKELSQEDYVNFIKEPVKPILHDIVSEGVGVVNADDVQNQGYNGSGVKVAIIDAGFTNYDSNPEIPLNQINEIKSFREDEQIETDVHGTACAEIIFDIVPNSDLYLYVIENDIEFCNALNYAINQDVDIISISLGFFNVNNLDGEGTICNALNNARDEGILVVVSAGNYAQKHYCGMYTDSDLNDFHDFDTGNEYLDLGFIEGGYPIDLYLSWNDWSESDQDYDLYLGRDGDEENWVDYSINEQTGSQEPTESIGVYAPADDNYFVCIEKYDASNSVRFQLFSYYRDFQDNKHSETSITCPSDAVGSTTIGATYYGDDTIESFSSQGPTNDGRNKPDLTAPDGVSTHAYGSGAFFGTSASAPHTAGAAALLLDLAPNLTVDELESKLELSSLDLGSNGKDNIYGSGRIDVWAAYNYIVPSVNFSFSPLNPNSSSSIQFTDSSSDTDGSLSSWSWDFGDGNTSAEQNPTHQYSDNGTYIVTLNVTDDDGATNETNESVIVLNVEPIADFSYFPTDPTDLQIVTFTDNSSDYDGTIVNWTWDFGDGNISYLQNSSHTFSDNGTYTITLNVTDDDGATNETTEQISIFNVAPKSNFTFNPLKPNVNHTIDFTDNSSDADGTVENWLWDFGDGNTSTIQNPTHFYTDNGTYTVTLNVTDNDEDTNQSSTQLSVYWRPNANFTYEPLHPTFNEQINFTDSSIDYDGSIVNWTWNFGDGNRSYDQNPNHTYPQPGSYLVSLNVTDNSSLFGIVSNRIVVNVLPEANFTYTPSTPRTENTITFNDTSLDSYGEINNWTWDFGDGNRSYLQNTTHSYVDNGTYTVNLTVTDNCTATDLMTKQITVLNTPPYVDFTYIPEEPTDIEIITFNDTSTDSDGTIVNWTWDFGDGNISYLQNSSHTFSDNGTYTITLNVTDDDGATNETNESITVLNVPPTIDFTYSPTNPVENQLITFNGSGLDQDGTIENWTWNFNDGNLSYSQNTTHMFTVFNSHHVNLTVRDNDGNTSFVNKTIVMKNKIINQTNEHTMTIINLTDEFDLVLNVNTTNTTNVNISKYSEIPSEFNGSTVNSIGKYFEIIVENESAIIWPMNLSIFYTRSELNNASLNEQQLLGVFFYNETIERWDLYNNTGVNTTNQSGYDGYLWGNIWHLTNMTAGGDHINPGNVTGLSVTDAKNGKLDLSWNASSDNIGIAYYRIYCDKKPTINTSDNTTSYQITGLTNDETYTFNVSAVDLAGNEGNQSDSKTGTPTSESSSTPPSSSPSFAPPPGPSNPLPTADAGGPYLGYVNTSIRFDGSGSSDDGSLVNFSWDFDDGSIGFGMNPSHTFESVGNYSVVLTVTDDNDSTAINTTMVSIEAVPPIAPTADADGPYVGIIDQQIVLDGSGSSDSDGSIVNYTWMGGYNKTWYGENPKVSYPISGMFSIQLTVTDDDNLTDNDTTSITVYVGEAVDIADGFVIDTDGDGTVDSYFNESSKTVTIMQETDDGNYLIDDNNDGSYDEKYDSATGGVTPYSPSSKEDVDNFWLYIAIIIIAIIAIIIVILIKMGILVIE